MPYKGRNLSIFLSVCLVFMIGCKSSKTLQSGEANLRLSTKQLIREINKKEPQFKTLSARVKLDVLQQDKISSYTVNLRMEKDKQILLMSTPISVVKALITPQKVSFYNKLDNTYFDGDFSYLSDLLGTELDFQKVQNLLLGEALYGLKNEPVTVSVNEKGYVVQPKNQNPLFELFYLINPSYFKISSQQLSQDQEQRHLQIDYLSYQEVEKEILPKQIKVIAVEEAEEMILEMEFKAVSLNEDLRFPFKIPSGYHEIEL